MWEHGVYPSAGRSAELGAVSLSPLCRDSAFAGEGLVSNVQEGCSAPSLALCGQGSLLSSPDAWLVPSGRSAPVLIPPGCCFFSPGPQR